MSEWLQLVLALVGSTTFMGAVTAGGRMWFQSRLEAENRRQAQLKILEDRVVALQDKIENLLSDATSRERETIRQLTERIETDKKQTEVITAATVALKEAAAAIARMDGALHDDDRRRRSEDRPA